MSIQGLLKEMHKTFILHAVASHFTNGLMPVAVLFLVLSLVSRDPYFEHTVLHLVMVSLCVIPVSFVSGIRDWRVKFHGVHVAIFHRKIKLSVLLLLVSAFVVAVRLSHPDVLAGHGVVTWLYAGSLFSILPIVVLLGHYGGMLASQLRQRG